MSAYTITVQHLILQWAIAASKGLPVPTFKSPTMNRAIAITSANITKARTGKYQQ